MLDEGDERVIRPVEVLEDQDEWPLACDPFDEATPRGERLLPLAGCRCGGADEGREARIEPVALRGIRYSLVNGHGQLRSGFLRRIRLENSCLSLDHLAQRPVRDACTVRK